MSNTTIKLKRTDYAASIDGLVLERGEPAVDFDRQILWIGDGDTNLEFAAVNSDAASHAITSAGGTGDTHTVLLTKFGSVLRSGVTSTTASFQRLGFYDLGDIATGTWTDAYPSQGLIDGTGLLSRWHWIDRTHAGPRRSLFYTDDSISGVGKGTNDLGRGNMRHAGDTTAGDTSDVATSPEDTTGYRVESLSYDTLDTIPGIGFGGPHVLVVDYIEDPGVNQLSFRRLAGQDLIGDAQPHDMISDSHTATPSCLFYSGLLDMKELSFAGVATSKVIKRQSDNALHWDTVKWSEITGTFTPTLLGDPAVNNASMRYSSTLGWVASNRVKNIDLTGGYHGLNINNSGDPAGMASIVLVGHNEGGSVNSYGHIFIPSIEGSEAASGSYLSTLKGLVLSVTDSTNKNISFYCTNNYLDNQPPNLHLRRTGSVEIELNTTASTYVLNGSTADATTGALVIRPKTVTYSAGSKAILPQFSAISVGSFVFIQNNNSVTSAASEIAGVRVGNFTYTEGTAQFDQKQTCSLFRGGNLDAIGSTFGLRVGNITTAASERFSSANGVYIGEVSCESTNSSSVAAALRCVSVASSGADTTAYGVASGSITSAGDAFGFACTGTISSARYTYGLHFAQLVGSTTLSTSINTGINIKRMRHGRWVSGVTITDMSSSTTDARIAGLYINVSTSDSAMSQTDENIPDIKHNIYTSGNNKHYFGGPVDIAGRLNVGGGDVYITGGNVFSFSSLTASGEAFRVSVGSSAKILLRGDTDITGTLTASEGLTIGAIGSSSTNYASTFYGDVTIASSRKLRLMGLSTATDSTNITLDYGKLLVSNGNIDVPNGIVREKYTVITNDSNIFVAQTGTAGLFSTTSTETDAQRKTLQSTRVVFLQTNFDVGIATGRGIHRIGRGFPGQIITLCYIPTTVSRTLAVFDKDYFTADPVFPGNPDILMSNRTGLFRNMHIYRALSFVCAWADPSQYTSYLSDSGSYHWVQLNDE